MVLQPGECEPRGGADYLFAGILPDLVDIYDHSAEQELHLNGLQLFNRLIESCLNGRNNHFLLHYLVLEFRGGQNVVALQHLIQKASGLGNLIAQGADLRHLAHIAVGLGIVDNGIVDGRRIVYLENIVFQRQGCEIRELFRVGNPLVHRQRLELQHIQIDTVGSRAVAVGCEYGVAAVRGVVIQEVVVRRGVWKSQIDRGGPGAVGIVPIAHIQIEPSHAVVSPGGEIQAPSVLAQHGVNLVFGGVYDLGERRADRPAVALTGSLADVSYPFGILSGINYTAVFVAVKHSP